METAASKPPEGGLHLVEWGCELAGTALLVFGGLSAVALDFGQDSPVADAIPSVGARLLITGLLFAGVGSLVAVSPLGRRSGGHINPAVTLAFRLVGRVHDHDLAGYVVAQLTGGLLGAAVWRLAWGHTAVSVGDGVTQPADVSPLAAAGIEAAMTAVLVLTIFAFLSSVRTMRWTPVAVWLLVATLVWRVATHTGTSLNPARSLGPASVASDFAHLWVYFAGPIVGALAAVGAWKVGMRERQVLTAKLFHDPSYRCVLGASVPAGAASA